MSQYKLVESTQYKKDLKRYVRDPRSFDVLMDAGYPGILPQMKSHKLKGFYKDHWECHIQPDLLIIWFQIDEPTKEIHLIRIGSHSELFN